MLAVVALSYDLEIKSIHKVVGTPVISKLATTGHPSAYRSALHAVGFPGSRHLDVIN